MDSERKVSEVFNNNPQGSRIRGRSKNRWWNCVQTAINKCKITNWKEGPKTGGESLHWTVVPSKKRKK
jgi:hypothetical protein